MRQRYGEYEQVNGATANRLMDEIERLERIEKAVLELLDSMDDEDDLQYITPLPYPAYRQLINTIRGESWERIKQSSNQTEIAAE